MTSRASWVLIRKGGMGGRSGLPVREMPVVSSLTPCSTEYWGSPAMDGAVLAQTVRGNGDSTGTGAPCSSFERSRSPDSLRGV